MEDDTYDDLDVVAIHGLWPQERTIEWGFPHADRSSIPALGSFHSLFHGDENRLSPGITPESRTGDEHRVSPGIAADRRSDDEHRVSPGIAAERRSDNEHRFSQAITADRRSDDEHQFRQAITAETESEEILLKSLLDKIRLMRWKWPHVGTLASDNMTWANRTVACTACKWVLSFARSKDTNERADGTDRELCKSIDGCSSQQPFIDHCSDSNMVSSRSTITEHMPKRPLLKASIAQKAESDKDAATDTCDMLNAAVLPSPNTNACQEGLVFKWIKHVGRTVTGVFEETAEHTLSWNSKTIARGEMRPRLEARQAASPGIQQHVLQWQLSRVDRFSLLLNQMVFPPLVWILLQSLDRIPPNVLDQRLQQLLPAINWGIAALQDHSTILLCLIHFLVGLESIALVKPLASMGKRQRLFSDTCCLLSLAVVLPLWARVGGSIITLFLAIVPYTLSMGMSLGLLFDHLWTRRRVKQTSGVCRAPFTPAGIDVDVGK